jgi:O-antigen biosynthesis protein
VEHPLVPARDESRIRVDGRFFARGSKRLHVHGVTYGPFAPNANGEPFATPERSACDFACMRAAGIDAIRVYHLPPGWLLDVADDAGLAVFVDVPWSKHLCFLDGQRSTTDARERVRRAASLLRDRRSAFALSIGNEIPADIVRWYGASAVERFLAELADEARQHSGGVPVTYGNFPPTEYLDLSFVDFATFNVYLHDREVFRRYLVRLQNLVGDRPLVLGELGMDTLRHGEDEQAAMLGGHLATARLTGVAGAFVYSWTDDWFTGGHQIENWAFGITRADRSAKRSLAAVKSVATVDTSALLPRTPRVSVVVCSYNGGATLDECLRSLAALEYPDYEVILVDDGSTDDTRAIVARHPTVRAIHQENLGLSAARNAGLNAATGSIIAYTDSDCFVDRDWLTHLVDALERDGHVGVGGPNLTPDDGWLVACVAASPGQPTHVLSGDEIAEHVPGCNMAFRRDALRAIGGFNVDYRRAGDDVDVCWRLQDAGMTLTFAPGAVVWHHRRNTPRAYFRQQAGYGEAEALLWFDHPDRFNRLGEARWRGVVYGAFARSLRVGGGAVFHGRFGAGLFQTIYQRTAAHWSWLPATLEWQVAIVLIALAKFAWPEGWTLSGEMHIRDVMVSASGGAITMGIIGLMIGLTMLVVTVQAVQADLPVRYRGVRARALIAALCWIQPIVRSFARYRTRFLPPSLAEAHGLRARLDRRLSLLGRLTNAYWEVGARDRIALLDRSVDRLATQSFVTKTDAGWSPWDLEIVGHPWASLRMQTVQEEHGSERRLIRVRYRLRLTGYGRIAAAALGLAAIVALELDRAIVQVVGPAIAVGAVAFWHRARAVASRAVAVVDETAKAMGLTSLQPSKVTRAAPAARRAPALRESDAH